MEPKIETLKRVLKETENRICSAKKFRRFAFLEITKDIKEYKKTCEVLKAQMKERRY